MYGTYVGNGLMLVAPRYGGRLFVSASEIHVMPLLVAHGVHEGPLTNWIAKHVHSGMRAVDVGANYGYFTVLLGYRVGRTGQVIAYEPQPEMASILRMNLATNYMMDWVTVREEAVGDTAGTTTLHWFSGEESAASVILERGDLRRNPQSREVPCVRLDDALAGLAGDIDFLKVDAEGAEFRILRGARETLARTRMVAFELNREMLGGDHEPLFELLAELQAADAAYHLPTAEGDLQPVDLADLRKVDFIHSVMIEMGVR